MDDHGVLQHHLYLIIFQKKNKHDLSVMRVQTRQTEAVAGMVSVSNFVSTYQENIRQSVVPPTQLSIQILNYYVQPSAGIDVGYSTLELQPTNVYSQRIWNGHVHGVLKKDVSTASMDIVFYNDDTENDELEFLTRIAFQGALSGTFVVRSSALVYDLTNYWTYLYNGDERTLTLTFQNSVSNPVDVSVDRLFDIHFNIPNAILASCQSGSVPYPPDNIKNTYCVHNSSSTGAFGGFAVSGDVVYRDYGQNYRITPSFVGSRNKLLLTLTRADPTLPEHSLGAFFGPIFEVLYVGGPMSTNSYITFENQTASTVCVWIDPTIPSNVTSKYLRSRVFVPSGKNTVALYPPFQSYFRYFDGEFTPCTL